MTPSPEADRRAGMPRARPSRIERQRLGRGSMEPSPRARAPSHTRSTRGQGRGSSPRPRDARRPATAAPGGPIPCRATGWEAGPPVPASMAEARSSSRAAAAAPPDRSRTSRWRLLWRLSGVLSKLRMPQLTARAVMAAAEQGRQSAAPTSATRAAPSSFQAKGSSSTDKWRRASQPTAPQLRSLLPSRTSWAVLHRSPSLPKDARLRSTTARSRASVCSNLAARRRPASGEASAALESAPERRKRKCSTTMAASSRGSEEPAMRGTGRR